MRNLVAVPLVLIALSKPIAGQHGDSHTATKSTPAPAPAASKASEPVPPKPAAAPTGSQSADLKAVADRINKAIASAAQPSEPASGASSRSVATTRPSVPPSRRVTLDWRVSVEWPAELLSSKF